MVKPEAWRNDGFQFFRGLCCKPRRVKIHVRQGNLAIAMMLICMQNIAGRGCWRM